METNKTITHRNVIDALDNVNSKDVVPSLNGGHQDSVALPAAQRLPVELWLKVLPNLGKNEHIILSTMNRSFRGAIRPHLFSTFAIRFAWRPLSRDDPPNDDLGIYLLYGDGPVDAKNRLHFYVSEEIAPLVKKCFFTLRCNGMVPRDAHYTEGEFLIQEFFTLLLKFSTLCHLELHGVALSSDRIDQIRKLRHLDELRLTDSFFCEEDDSEQQLPISSFSISQSHTRWLHQVDPEYTWTYTLAMAEPSRLTHLHVWFHKCHDLESEFEPPMCTLLRYPIMDPNTRFSSLLSLRLPQFAINSPHLVSFLERCPNLRELTLLETGALHEEFDVNRPSHPLPSTILPRLHKLEAPYYVLSSFTSCRMRELVIREWTASQAVFDILNRFDHPDCLEYLTIEVFPITNVLLWSICRRFKGLRSLSTIRKKHHKTPRVSEPEVIWDYMVQYLTILMTPTLEALSLEMSCSIPTPEVKDAFFDAMVKRCPNLESLEILFTQGLRGFRPTKWQWARCS
ncbi:hypothetical protein JAAARDRAFT_205113 [Jaapia argillacea MUCL 33604]|uniref:F-box domain-containing protein n=1 Tax=Jaapia argillacea MUCL 33604 TaxID=933084 RepID=A0A067QBU3_9AGAM|nr:hypothetical protein JAAARDRAFT_205113 [Jaapia argillacea MUCL 33604]